MLLGFVWLVTAFSDMIIFFGYICESGDSFLLSLYEEMVSEVYTWCFIKRTLFVFFHNSLK